MVDSYKKQNGYLCCFCLWLCVSRGNIFERQEWIESIFAYVQLHFILNIIMYYSLHSCSFFWNRKLQRHYLASTVNEKRLFGDFDFVYSEIFSHENFKTTTVLVLNTRLYETLSIFHFEKTIFYTVNSIVSDSFMINFVYTLCISTPGQIQQGRFIRALGDMIRDQESILYLLFEFTSMLQIKLFAPLVVSKNSLRVNKKNKNIYFQNIKFKIQNILITLSSKYDGKSFFTPLNDERINYKSWEIRSGKNLYCFELSFSSCKKRSDFRI